MKNLVILGSTGSIGRQALEIVEKHPAEFSVLALAAKSHFEELYKQANKFKPRYLALYNKTAAQKIAKQTFSFPVEVRGGGEGIESLAVLPEADIVLNALVGAAGLSVTLASLKAGKRLALANKESLVAGGEVVKQVWQKHEGEIIPVDSEHSALFQCLLGEPKKVLKKIIITGSGGPFRGKTLKELEQVKPAEALSHPRWTMGPKITIDSATLMNKGLEVIEAHYLFDVPYDQIEVVIHPQSLVHGLVEFKDGSIKAQIGLTDMRLPIQYALTFPERKEGLVKSVNLSSLNLNFEPPDLKNFPCLSLALKAGQAEQGFPIVLNAANEVAVYAFLEGQIKFTSINKIVEFVMEKHQPIKVQSYEEIVRLDKQARIQATKLIEKGDL